MRASLMDLRERVLLDSDAGMKAADVAAKYRVSALEQRVFRGTGKRQEGGRAVRSSDRQNAVRLFVPSVPHSTMNRSFRSWPQEGANGLSEKIREANVAIIFVSHPGRSLFSSRVLPS